MESPVPLPEHPLLRDERGRMDLRSLSRSTMEAWFEQELGETAGRGRRVYQWIWQRGATSFEGMDKVPKALRARLPQVARISQLELVQEQISADGTVKYLWGLEDGRAVESVIIPEEERLTLCISSQVGCAMGCTFCLTGDLGLVRQLKPAEIAGQVLQVGQRYGQRPTNVVFMGMGEPLHNVEHVLTALEILLDEWALNHSHRKVTVSTSGLVPQLQELARRSPVNIAVSLNASTQAQRAELMPISRRWPLEQLLGVCAELPLPAGKRITYEYVMFAGRNDSLEDAARLFELLRPLKAKLNLIPYNGNPDRPTLLRPDDAVVKAFQHHFVSRGLSCSIRATRGQDISAACGQLGKGAQGASEPA